jgi:cobalt-zinc-cadmium efflux system protein
LHDHGHTHTHAPASGRILGWSLAATLLFVAAEFISGVRAHSLALISDAGHNATDALALLLSWFAVWMQTKPADESRTYGYHRAGVLAAFVNALTLIVLSVWILYESAVRLLNPVDVQEQIMLWVAAGGLLLNGGVMLALHRGADHDINIRGVFLHMMGDLIGSAAIIVGALLIGRFGWRQIDPALSIAIAVLIIWTAWDITRESLNILLEGLPRGVELPAVIDAIRQVDGVLGVHDLHVWSLGSHSHALSCHVVIEDMPPSRSDRILSGVNAVLGERFRIHHCTVQFEHMSCMVSGTGCVVPVSAAQAHQHSH